MCNERQTLQPLAGFDMQEFERRRLRLEELLEQEIERRCIALPASVPEPLALPMPSRLKEHGDTSIILDAEFQETSKFKAHLRALRTLLVSLTIAGSLVTYLIITSQS